MKTFYYNIIEYSIRARSLLRRFVQGMPDILTDEEFAALENDPIHQEIMKETDEYIEELSRIPLFYPENTALFMTLDPDNSSINHFTEFYYRRKSRLACRHLLERGYTTFIVNAGTQYGMIAMEELLQMKKAGYSFQLYRGTVSGERRSLLQNILHEAFMSTACDKNFQVYHPLEYVEHIVRQVSAICTEKGVLTTNQNVPIECMFYYHRLAGKKKLQMGLAGIK